MEKINGIQGIVTTFSHEDVGPDEYLTIKQGQNKVFLTKHQVLDFLVEKGPAMVERWKISDGILKEAYVGE